MPNNCCKNKTCGNSLPYNTLQENGHKTLVDYSKKSIGGFKPIVIYPSPKLINGENDIIASYFGASNQYQSFENASKQTFTYIIQRWNKYKFLLDLVQQP